MTVEENTEKHSCYNFKFVSLIMFITTISSSSVRRHYAQQVVIRSRMSGVSA